MKKTFLLFGIFLLLFCYSNTYSFDYEVGELPSIANNSRTFVFIVTSGEAEGIAYENGRYVKKRGRYYLSGSGVIMSGGKIATASHVVSPEVVSIRTGDAYYTVTEVVKVISKQIVVNEDIKIGSTDRSLPAVIDYMDVDRDIAILSYDNSNYAYLKSLEIESSYTRVMEFFGPFDLLLPGNVIGIIVHKRDSEGLMLSEVEIRYGKIISNNPLSRTGEQQEIFHMEDFTMEVEVYPGDSGSPIIMWNGGKPVFIGILHSTEARVSYSSWSYGIRLDWLKNILDA
jgi:hypothetical protein